MLPAKFQRKILVGATTVEIVTVEVRMGDDINTLENQYISFTHDSYDREFMDDAEGEEKARDYLDDGEDWKQAVEADRTTDGKDDYNEYVLSGDGWQSILGDMEQVGDLWTRESSSGAGAGPTPGNYVKLAITKKDILFIQTEALKLHLKKLREVDNKELMSIRAVFEKYPPFDMDQMEGYSNQAPDSEEDEETEERKNPATPFTATWSSEPSHGSPPPPRNMPTEWFDEDGRAILPEHEEEFMDLVIYKFWRGDQVMNEKVMTKGAFMGRHDKGKEYEWAHWDGEYGLSINQYGPTDPPLPAGTLLRTVELSLPAGTLLRTIELNGVEIVYHILAPIKSEGKLRAINRLFVRTNPELVANAGRVGWIPEEERVPLAIAIDKTHFVIRKMLKQGRKYYPILNWIEIETWTENGVEPDMKLAAVVGPDGVHMLGYDTLPVPGYSFNFNRVMSGRDIYIELKSPPEPRPGSTGALEHLMFGNELNAELKRIFNVALEVDVAEIPVESTAIADIQERVDNIEREIRMLRVKEKDFSSSNSAVAARLGKQEEYDKLMRERDEAMWRGNPEKRRVVTKQDMRKRAKLPKLLYHGTSIQNMHRVLREGLLVHQPQSAYTVESEHQEDTNLNVSLANTVQDAVFFSLGAAGWGADQAIIEFDTTDMPEERYPAILRRPLFGKTGRFEYKFYTMKGIPPERISRVLIRSFEKPAGRLEVVEKWYTREEALSLPST